MPNVKIIKKEQAKTYLYFDNVNDAYKLGGTPTTNRHIFWIPRLLKSFEEVIDYYNGEVDQELLDVAYELLAEKETTEMIEEVEIKHHELFRPYQNKGVSLLKHKGNFGLFWEQRTGKTPTTCLGTKHYKKVIIAVPAGLELTWKHEYIKWTGREDVFTIPKTPAKRKETYKEFNNAGSMILIGSYKTLAKDISFKMKNSNKTTENQGIWVPLQFDALVLDEAHFLRNKSQQSIGMQTLRNYSKNAIALTGTPATNGAEDVLPILNFITGGTIPKWPFINYFFEQHRTVFGMEISGVKELRQDQWVELLSQHSQQLKMKEVNSWVPEVVESTVYVEMTPKQRQYYEEMERDYHITNDENEVVKMEENRLTQIISLIRIGLDPKILGLKGKSGKTLWLKEYIKENPDKPLIIAADATSYLKELDKELFDGKALKITGEQSAIEKTEAQRAFQAGESNVILLNTKAGATGWTLDRSNTTIFVDISWNPTDNKQLASRMMSSREDRVNGSKEVIYLQNEDSIDELKKYAVDHKLSKTEIVNNFIKWLRKESYEV